MIELVRDLRVINVLAKFENDPWKIMDVRVLTGLVCPAARPPGVRQYPGALKGCGVKTNKYYRSFLFVGISVERPVMTTSNISEWQSKITNTSLSIMSPRAGGGINTGPLKVCFIGKGLVIVPGLQFTSLSSLHLLDKLNSNINRHVVQDFTNIV